MYFQNLFEYPESSFCFSIYISQWYISHIVSSIQFTVLCFCLIVVQLEEQLSRLQREKNDLQSRMEEDQEDMNELMKKHKAAVAQVTLSSSHGCQSCSSPSPSNTEYNMCLCMHFYIYVCIYNACIHSHIFTTSRSDVKWT